MMLVHHKGRATTPEGRARPPAGSLFAPSGGRQRRLTVSRIWKPRIAGATLPTRRSRNDDHMYHPSMKVSTRPGAREAQEPNREVPGPAAAQTGRRVGVRKAYKNGRGGMQKYRYNFCGIQLR